MAREPRHLISLSDLEQDALDEVLELSARLKKRGGRGELTGKTVGMLFFRGSLRTRASLEAAVLQLGGNVVNLTAMSDFWELEDRDGVVMDGKAPEHIRDAAAVLSRYVHGLAIRPTPKGSSWEVDRRDPGIRTWARHASVPVMNMDSSLWHPLQALADLLTLKEHLGDLRGQVLAVSWVHSPQPASPSAVHSLLQAALGFGMQVRLAHPPGYELDAQVLAEAEGVASRAGGELVRGLSQDEAASGARVVYARSWFSLEHYANPTLAANQRSRHTAWRIDEKLLARGQDARVMHAMPVRRNVEITDEVMDGPRSLLYEQAANRLPSQMALLTHLLR